MHVRTIGILLTLLVALHAVHVAAQPSVQGIRPLTERPLAVRGGVMLLELDAVRHGNNWPRTIPVRLGRRDLNGRVVWIYAVDRPESLHWTSPPMALRVRDIRADDESATGVGRPLLLTEIPPEADGRISVLGRDLDPIFIDLPPPDADAAMLDPEVATDRPDPDSPFEYWRWVLLAERLEMSPPPPPGDLVSRLIARYHADLWRLGMSRLRDASPGVADECLELLTGTCRDGQRILASWVTDADSLQRLLQILVDPDRGPDRLAQGALDWADTRETLFLWVERDHGEQVQLAMANPRRTGRLVQFRWVFGDAQRDRAEIPIMVELAPGAVTRVIIDRPSDEPDSTGRGRPAAAVQEPQLLVESEGFSRRFQVRPGLHYAAPPGFSFGVFFPPLTLADAAAFRLRAPSPAYLTSADLRRRHGRWELFIECFRPGGAPAHRSMESLHIAELPGPLEVAGHEAITLFIGPSDAATVVLTVPEVGRHILWTGHDATGRLAVRRASHSDRWWCTIELPDEWIGYPFDDHVLLGLSRTHDGDQHVETAPNPALPWNPDPGRAAVNLQNWQDLPGTPRR